MARILADAHARHLRPAPRRAHRRATSCAPRSRLRARWPTALRGRRPPGPPRRHARAAPRARRRGARDAPSRSLRTLGRRARPGRRGRDRPRQPRPRARSSPWLDAARRKPLGLETAHPAGAAPRRRPRRSARWLGTKRTSVAYPGVCGCATTSTPPTATTSTCTATMPTFERIAAGVMQRARRPAAGAAAARPTTTSACSRRCTRGSTPPRSASATTGAAAGAGRAAQGLRAARGRRPPADAAPRCWPPRSRSASAALNRLVVGPLSSDLSRPVAAPQRPATAMAEAVARLGIDADHVIFGHTHRAGPLPDDDAAEWRPPPARAAQHGLLGVRDALHRPGRAGAEPLLAGRRDRGRRRGRAAAAAASR